MKTQCRGKAPPTPTLGDLVVNLYDRLSRNMSVPEEIAGRAAVILHRRLHNNPRVLKLLFVA